MKRKHTEKKSANRGISFIPRRPKDWFKGMHHVADGVLHEAQKRREREREFKTEKSRNSK